MSVVPDIHDVLHWSNRTLVAEEITRRGFRVSKETLNRWVRQRKEVPAAVEHIVFDLFGIGGQQEEPPAWAGDMEHRLRLELERNRSLIEALAPPDIREAAARVIERLEALPPQGDEALAGADGGEAPGAAAPPGRGPGSRRGRVVG